MGAFAYKATSYLAYAMPSHLTQRECSLLSSLYSVIPMTEITWPSLCFYPCSMKCLKNFDKLLQLLDVSTKYNREIERLIKNFDYFVNFAQSCIRIE